MHTANHTVNSLRIAMRKALRPYGMNFVDDLENSGRFKIITKAEAASVFGVGRSTPTHHLIRLKRLGTLVFGGIKPGGSGTKNARQSRSRVARAMWTPTDCWSMRPQTKKEDVFNRY